MKRDVRRVEPASPENVKMMHDQSRTGSQ